MEVCDRFPEDLNVNLYKTSTTDVINNVDNQKWYLSYQTKNDLTSDNLTNPVSVRVIPEKNTAIYQSNSNLILNNNLSDGKWYIMYASENNGGFLTEFSDYVLGNLTGANAVVSALAIHKGSGGMSVYAYTYDKTSGQSNQATTVSFSISSVTASGISKIRILSSADLASQYHLKLLKSTPKAICQ